MNSKLSLLAFCLASTLSVFSQNSNANSNAFNNRWSIDGNMADSSYFVGTINTQPLRFRTSNNERLRITQDGMVGIGTANPETKLDVNGDATLRSGVRFVNIPPANGLNNVLVINSGGQVQSGSIAYLNSLLYEEIACSENSLQTPTWANGVAKVYLSCPNVRVGIGTSNPQYGLHVTSTAFVKNTFQVDGDVAIGAVPNGYGKLYLRNTFNSAALHLESTNTTQASKLILLQYAHPTAELLKAENTTSGHIPVLLLADGTFTFSSSSKKLLQLDEDGLLHARKIKVDTQIWPDYVFAGNYPLQSLSEVEHFIHAEKHLPGVPSEEKVLQEGIDLAEMNVILLQKVEEITLYLIEQDKIIRKLEKEMEELRPSKK